MNLNILLSTTQTNILYTVGIVSFIAIILVLEHFLLKKDERIKGWVLFIIYFVTFLVILGSILLLFHIWGFDIPEYANTTLANISDVLTESIGRIVSSLIILFVTFFILKFSKKGFKRIGQKEGPNQKRKKQLENYYQVSLDIR